MGFIRNFIALYKDIKRNGEMASKYLQMTPEELSALNDEELREAIDSVLVYYIDKDDIERLNMRIRLYFLCYMIERVARKLHQRNKYVVNRFADIKQSGKTLIF